MKLFIANCSKQSTVLSYRIPEVPNVVHSPIGIGGQIVAAGSRDLSRPQIDSIIGQLRKYGMRDVSEVIQSTDVIPYICSVDEHVRPEEIQRVMHHNMGALTLRGQQLRKDAAIATNSQMETAGAAPSSLEMTVQEESAPVDGAQPIAEGVRVRKPSGKEGSKRRGG